LGNYNPDWAVLVQHDGQERLYFVVETKSTALLFDDARRGTENAKIQCGKAHFTAIAAGDNPARFIVAASFDDVLNNSVPNDGSQPSDMTKQTRTRT
jgi:type III restriction enzyme